MKVKFRNSKELLRVLGTVENILKKNKSETKLQYIKLEKVEDKLCIIARNPFMRLGYFIEDTLSIEGDSALYEYKTLISLLNVLDDEIEINDKEIKNKKCKYSIPIVDTEGYPEDAPPEVANNNEINTKEFIDGLNGVFCATAKNEYESVLTGVYVNGNQLVACDSNRIHIKTLETELDKVILSRDMVNELLRLPFQEKMYMSIFGQNVIFKDDNLYIASNFIVGDYPKYEQLLPKDEKNKISFNKKDLENALNLMIPVADQYRNNCCLEIRQDDAKIYIENETKKAETLIPVSLFKELDESINVMFNISYLMDMLKVNSESIVMIQHEGTYTGYSFISENARQYIMPMNK